MCEVTTENFEAVYPELEIIFNEARFISIDIEFSCLVASAKLRYSLFDSGADRYKKVRATVEQTIPLQIGLTAFKYNSDSNSYIGHPYTFYTLPVVYESFDKLFLFQASSLQFLVQYDFDFNKLFYKGIPFLNSDQEVELLDVIKNGGINDTQNSLFETILDTQATIVSSWFYNANDFDTLVLNNVDSYKSNIIYMLHKALRMRYKNYLWTYIDNKKFTVQKVNPETFKNLTAQCDLDKHLIDYMLGFTKVYRLLKSAQKPLIGHNLLHDLLVLIHNFDKPLPKYYSAFKALVNTSFSTIYDTKRLSFELSHFIPETKRWQHNSLESLFYYFKDSHGRHLALNSPIIECSTSTQQKFHSAGWDSFCTGYIFIRMSHWFAAQNFPNIKERKFVASELLHAVLQFKNRVNIARGSVTYISLDGSDPVSHRPPPFIIESITSTPVNIDHVTSLLSTYGYIEVKPHSCKGHRVIVAVDNIGSARRILRQFPSNSGYKIQQYSALKHSPVVRSILWLGVIFSGATLTWFGYSKLNKIN